MTKIAPGICIMTVVHQVDMDINLNTSVTSYENGWLRVATNTRLNVLYNTIQYFHC